MVVHTSCIPADCLCIAEQGRSACLCSSLHITFSCRTILKLVSAAAAHVIFEPPSSDPCSYVAFSYVIHQSHMISTDEMKIFVRELAVASLVIIEKKPVCLKWFRKSQKYVELQHLNAISWFFFQTGKRTWMPALTFGRIRLVKRLHPMCLLQPNTRNLDTTIAAGNSWKQLDKVL